MNQKNKIAGSTTPNFEKGGRSFFEKFQYLKNLCPYFMPNKKPSASAFYLFLKKTSSKNAIFKKNLKGRYVLRDCRRNVNFVLL